jgi:crotonobetainyl-CoA:carnitine CoA-transferase CaiB-like acyl-CoA transferase
MTFQQEAATASKATSEVPAGLLAGLRVVDLGGGLAARVLGMLLAEQGAQVVGVVDLACPSVDPVLDAILGRGKLEVAIDPCTSEGRASIDRLVASADVVVTDLSADTLVKWGLDFDRIRAGVNPGLISCTIPAFTTADPRSRSQAGDAMAGAAGCLYERALGSPRFHLFPVPSILGALFAASGVIAGLVARQDSGRGQHVEANLFGSSLFAQILLVLMRTGVPRGFLPLKLVATPFMKSWECRDGRWAYLHVTLPSHNARLLDVLIGAGLAQQAEELRAVLSEQTMRDPSQVGSISEARQIVRVLKRIFLLRTADEWEASLGKELCCIKVRTIDEWLRDSLDAGMSDASVVNDPVFGSMILPGPGVVCPEQPAVIGPRIQDASVLPKWLEAWEAVPRSSPTPEDESSVLSKPQPPLAGIRVVDLSRIIAGPCAARVLAELGAEVTSIQSPTSLDWALSFHLMFNAGKRSVTIDAADDAGKLAIQAVLGDIEPHVVLQNYRHLDVARVVGVGPETLRAKFPDLVYAHLNAYGDKGTWQERPGFEQVVQAVSGIQMTYGEEGRPRLLPTPVIDIGSGLSGAMAALLGLYHQRRTGQGVFVTTHLTWVAVLLQVRQVAAVQRDACLRAAAQRGTPQVIDAGLEVLADIVRTRDGNVCVVGPRRDVSAWLAGLGIEFSQDKASQLQEVGHRLRWKSLATLQNGLVAAGLADRVVLMPSQKLRTLLKDLEGLNLGLDVPLRKQTYPGCPMDMAVLRSPLRLSRTPLVNLAPPPLRGANTREALARVGIEVPEGHNVSPYPKDPPYLPWLASLVRWGFFAWRSGNI